jgi:hypothetical protein
MYFDSTMNFFLSPQVYLIYHSLKNKIDPIFNPLAIYFLGCDFYLNFDEYIQTYFKHVVLKYSFYEIK